MASTPHHIEQAKIDGNIELLRTAGRKGGTVTAKRREADRVMDAHLLEQRAREDAARRAETNEDSYPVNIYE